MKNFWQQDDNLKVRKQVIFLLMLFFIVSFLTNFSFMYISKLTYNGVVTENPYDKGTAYNDVLAQNQHQQELDWLSDINISCFSEVSSHYNLPPYIQQKYNNVTRVPVQYQSSIKGIVCKISVTLSNKDNSPIINKIGKLIISRPVSDKIPDMEVNLHDNGNGSYISDFHIPEFGLWEIRIFIREQNNKRIAELSPKNIGYEFFISKKLIIL